MLDLTKKIVTVKSSSQALTDTLADLGSEINVVGFDSINLYLNVDINDSSNVTVAILGKLEEGGTVEYYLPFDTLGTAKTLVDKSLYEINYDADGGQVVSVPLYGASFVQVQVKAGTVGASAGNITSCYAVLI
jgi:hypothetical protein